MQLLGNYEATNQPAE